jgi:CRISPR/Cas system-associated exonuclease Cas4 (RecB family)
MTPEYKLQLAIYALLYEEKHGKKPDIVGVDFLRHKSHHLKVDQELVDFAKLECRFIQEQTISEDIEDYSKKKGFLCNYCDFYEHCFGQKKINEF